MATARLFQVDTFTDRPFAGNPAGVCLLETEPETEWLQAVATELRMPATAFAIHDDGGWKLRWFTVNSELEICGHGTVAAAHVLWETGTLALAEIAMFVTASGPITATREAGSIFLALQAGRVEETEAPPALNAAGIAFESVWRTPLDYLLVLDSPTAVDQLAPAMDDLTAVDTRGSSSPPKAARASISPPVSSHRALASQRTASPAPPTRASAPSGQSASVGRGYVRARLRSAVATSTSESRRRRSKSVARR